jgi:hypothetical protein
MIKRKEETRERSEDFVRKIHRGALAARLNV